MPKKAKVKIKTPKEKRPAAKPKNKIQKTIPPKKIKTIQKEEPIIKKEDIITTGIIEENIKADRDKRFILWSGVVFFMILIFVFWIFNIKNTIQISQGGDKEDFDFNNISNGFSESVEQMKKDLAELKNFSSPKTPEEISTSTPADGASSKDIFELRARLEELENKIGTSTETKAEENNLKN